MAIQKLSLCQPINCLLSYVYTDKNIQVQQRNSNWTESKIQPWGREYDCSYSSCVFSLSQGRKLDLSNISDSQGKEYSKNVLFGSNLPFYIGLVCVHYNLYKTDEDIPKYIKMHIDDGLELMNKELKDNPNLNGMDYLMDKIEKGLIQIC